MTKEPYQGRYYLQRCQIYFIDDAAVVLFLWIYFPFYNDLIAIWLLIIIHYNLNILVNFRWWLPICTYSLFDRLWKPYQGRCYSQHYSIRVQRSRLAALCSSSLIHRWRCNCAFTNFYKFLFLSIMTQCRYGLAIIEQTSIIYNSL